MPKRWSDGTKAVLIKRLLAAQGEAGGSPSRRAPLSPMGKSSPSQKKKSAATQSKRFGERIAAGKYASSSEDEENDDEGVNAIAAVARARELIALAEKPKPKKGVSGSAKDSSSSRGVADRARMIVLRLTVVALTKSERSPEHPSWCDAVLDQLLLELVLVELSLLTTQTVSVEDGTK